MDWKQEKEAAISKILSVSEICSQKLEVGSLERIAIGLQEIPGITDVHFCLKDEPFFIKAVGRKSSQNSEYITFKECPSSQECMASFADGISENKASYFAADNSNTFRSPIMHFDNFFGTLIYSRSRPLDNETNQLLSMLIEKLALNMFATEEATRQKLVSELYRLMASRVSLEMLFQPLLKEFSKVISFERAALAVPAKEQEIVKILGVRNESGRLIPVKEQAKIGDLWIGKALTSKDIVTNKDQKGLTGYIDYVNLTKRGYVNLIAIPLMSGNKNMGALCFSNSRSYDYIQRELNFFQSVGSDLATMLERQTYYEQLREQKNHLKRQAKEINVSKEITRSILTTRKIDELLNSVISQVRRLIACDGINVLIKSPEDRSSYILPRVDFSSAAISFRQGINLKKKDTALTICLQKNETVIWEDIDKAPLTEFDKEITSREKIGSTITFPLMIEGRPLGVLIINYKIKRKFSRNEVKLAQGLAQEVAVALDRAMQRMEEKKILLTLQSNFVSEEPPVIEGWKISTHYSSATRHSVVGGDFFDFVVKDDRLFIIVGDVCGKGIMATATTLMVKHAIRAFLFENSSLSKVVARLNRHLTNELKSRYEGFVALFIAEVNINKGIVKFISAGQPAPIILSDGKSGLKAKILDSISFPPLGIFSDHSYKTSSKRLSSGESLFIYTDGLPEVGVYNKAALGTEGIVNMFTSIKGGEPGKIIANLVKRVMADYMAIDDDVAMVLIKNVMDEKLSSVVTDAV